jgi:protein-tyrosine phosphatase
VGDAGVAPTGAAAYDRRMHKWILDGQLAISTRPGYRPGAETRVPREAVDAWVAEMRAAGIASIVCLLDDDQLPLYRTALPDGLVSHYVGSGFAVAHIPTADGQGEPFTPAQLDEAWDAFERLPKPVLVHCSAGHDRTGRVVAHILARFDAQRGDSEAQETQGRSLRREDVA